MRHLPGLALIFCLVITLNVFAGDASELREKGIQALKQSETDAHAIVDAARSFAKAALAYSDAGDDSSVVEMNSFLYWCKKKMTLENIEEFKRGEDSKVADNLTAV